MRNLRIIGLKPGEGAYNVVNTLLEINSDKKEKLVFDFENAPINRLGNIDIVRIQSNIKQYIETLSDNYDEVFLCKSRSIEINFDYDWFYNFCLLHQETKFFLIEQLDADGNYSRNLFSTMVKYYNMHTV